MAREYNEDTQALVILLDNDYYGAINFRYPIDGDDVRKAVEPYFEEMNEGVAPQDQIDFDNVEWDELYEDREDEW